jgi:hypothetical protein
MKSRGADQSRRKRVLSIGCGVACIDQNIGGAYFLSS